MAPRGCGPALIAEAQLRREAGLPALFVYNDGDPIDEARLAGFAWRLHSRPARREPRAGAAARGASPAGRPASPARLSRPIPPRPEEDQWPST